MEFRTVPAQRFTTVTRHAAGFGSHHIGPVVSPIFPEVLGLLAAAGAAPGAAVALFTADESGDGSGVLVTGGFEVGDDVARVDGLDVHVLPAVERAVVAVHHGATDRIDGSWTALMRQVEEQERCRPTPPARSTSPRATCRSPSGRPASCNRSPDRSEFCRE